MRRLTEAESKVMNILWANEPVTAKRISDIAKEEVGWSINTTYTIITKLCEKGFITRNYPKFTCTSTYPKEEVRLNEIDKVVDRFFNGSKELFFSALLDYDKLDKKEIEELRKVIKEK
ncbi:MAG: BlaI/MecI/CopY family transcriptional regulator [Clostridia bacterium]|nr:BlaI/MecI/CopY family transcriptional regulator [Clostridia bacterium]